MIKLFQIFIFFIPATLFPQSTEVIYLSGKGPEDAKEWDFYCTEGRNSGYWSKIKVPSNWELQGYGTYNYGLDPDSVRGKEHGLYKHRFTVPKSWNRKTVNIVFEGSMTDTEVKINGKKAGPIHQGSFYRFKYDISDNLKYGRTNILEVNVAKHSANKSINSAERKADYWIFGGIFRPVYLEGIPEQHINHIAIDAKADGSFRAEIKIQNLLKDATLLAQIFTTDHKKIGQVFSKKIAKNSSKVTLETLIREVKRWSPEFPHLYDVEISLVSDHNIIHLVKERFGFRTVEIRERDGIYVNGEKIIFKGICRHSFWPTTGRCLSKEMSILDVNLMKDMNMNSVRMSHYPPDEHFLDVCDSIGLFVLEELAGWQTYYDSIVGEKLVTEMIERDVNHPSIVIWDNGNEGGWNVANDKWFELLDPQKRPLIHPWGQFKGTDTHHYPKYSYGVNRYRNNHFIYFPTELLHGLYDGGHGAGLEDYWNLYKSDPLSAGGFLWDFSDEAVVRTDKKGVHDSDKNHGADGIVGPYREKEGSYYTVKEIWAPIQFPRKYITAAFNGSFELSNEFNYTNLSECDFVWQLLRMPLPAENSVQPHIIATGKAKSPDIAPGEKGMLYLGVPLDISNGDVLSIAASDPHGREIYQWTWPVRIPFQVAREIIEENNTNKASLAEKGNYVIVTGGEIQVTFDKTSGELVEVENSKGIVSFNGGPQPAGLDATFMELKYSKQNNEVIVEALYEGGIEKITWTMRGDGLLKFDLDYMARRTRRSYLYTGISFSYPEEKITGMRWMGNGPYRVWKNRMKGNTLQVWHKAYNNTITGESFDNLIYPEFKGYHSGLYWVTVENTESPFTILCENENIFLRMLTPETPKGAYNENTAPEFPSGDISFLHGINAIGTKFQPAANLSPMSQPGMYNQHRGDQGLPMVLWFDFRLNSHK